MAVTFRFRDTEQLTGFKEIDRDLWAPGFKIERIRGVGQGWEENCLTSAKIVEEQGYLGDMRRYKVVSELVNTRIMLGC